MSNRRLEGKIAIITGGGGGIGSAAGKIFCEEGAKVALVDREAAVVEVAAEDIRRQVAGAEVIGLVADLGEESAAQTVVDAVLRNFGGLNGAGEQRGYQALRGSDRCGVEYLGRHSAGSICSASYRWRGLRFQLCDGAGGAASSTYRRLAPSTAARGWVPTIHPKPGSWR